MRDIDLDPGRPDTWADQLLRELADGLTQPHAGECLQCYVARMLEEFRCDCTLRFALNYRDRCAPRATGLADRLARAGGCCDCEIFLNGWVPHPRLWTPGSTEVDGGITFRSDPEPPDHLPECTGVRTGSTQPCALWVRRGRSSWW
jgi:hypothetical protein